MGVAEFGGSAVAFPQVPPSQTRSSKSDCARILSGLSNPAKTRIPNLPPKDSQVLERIRSELKSFPGVVVYFPSTIEGKVGFVRLEFDSARSVTDERYFPGTLSGVEFRNWVYAARLRSNVWARGKLAPLLPSGANDDVGKMVLFVDNGQYQILPKAFQREEGLVVASGSIKRAIESNAELQRTTISANFQSFGLFAIPETPTEYLTTFQEPPSDDARFGSLEEWKAAAGKARELLAEKPFELIAGLGKKTTSKDAVLKSLEDVNGIMFIVAHASGADLVLSSGERIQIRPQDIERLRLTKAPFVFLRVCYGGDNGFAQAFLKAGARAVWTNRGAIHVNDAVTQAQMFVDALRSGKTVADAMKTVLDSQNIASESTTLFTRLFNLFQYSKNANSE
jgi:CHAT domain